MQLNAAKLTVPIPEDSNHHPVQRLGKSNPGFGKLDELSNVRMLAETGCGIAVCLMVALSLNVREHSISNMFFGGMSFDPKRSQQRGPQAA